MVGRGLLGWPNSLLGVQVFVDWARAGLAVQRRGWGGRGRAGRGRFGAGAGLGDSPLLSLLDHPVLVVVDSGKIAGRSDDLELKPADERDGDRMKATATKD